MESTVHAHNAETASVWTDEKHVKFLNTMEASFVRTMLHRRQDAPSNNHHHRHHLRLDRHLPDSAESTLDSKPRSCKIKKHAPSDSTGSRARIASRRMRRISSQLRNSSQQDQEVPQLENGREDASCVAGHHDKDQTSYS